MKTYFLKVLTISTSIILSLSVFRYITYKINPVETRGTCLINWISKPNYWDWYWKLCIQ